MSKKQVLKKEDISKIISDITDLKVNFATNEKIKQEIVLKYGISEKNCINIIRTWEETNNILTKDSIKNLASQVLLSYNKHLQDIQNLKEKSFDKNPNDLFMQKELLKLQIGITDSVARNFIPKNLDISIDTTLDKDKLKNIIIETYGKLETGEEEIPEHKQIP